MLSYLRKSTSSEVSARTAIPNLPDISYTESLDFSKLHHHLVTFNQCVDWRTSETIHPAYLAMHAIKMQKHLLLHPQQPFAPLGLVHMGNIMRYKRLFHTYENIEIECRFGQVWGQKLGWVFSVDTFASVQGEQVLHLQSHYLFRQKKRFDSPQVVPYAPDKIAFMAHIEQAKKIDELLLLKRKLGRQYARISGDYNPIHLSQITAKMFGFRQPIIHGMWSKARAISALVNCSDVNDIDISPFLHQSSVLTVQFTNFISLPNQVQFFALVQNQHAQGAVEVAGLPPLFEAHKAPRPYLLMRWEPSEPKSTTAKYA